MPEIFPSPFAVVRINRGEGNRHLYVVDDDNVEMFATEDAARKAVVQRCRERPEEEFALMKIVSVGKAAKSPVQFSDA